VTVASAAVLTLSTLRGCRSPLCPHANLYSMPLQVSCNSAPCKAYSARYLPAHSCTAAVKQPGLHMYAHTSDQAALLLFKTSGEFGSKKSRSRLGFLRPTND